MATAKKTSAKPKTVSKAPVKKATTARRIPHLYKERNPECHKISGKFAGLYVMFAITTLIFAAVAIYFFVFSVDIQNKYDDLRDDVQRDKNSQNAEAEEPEYLEDEE